MRINCFLLCLAIASVCVFPFNSLAQVKDIPDISIEFPGLIDGACSRISGKPLDQDAIDELETRMDEFVGAWKSIGPMLMREAVAVTGVPFGFHERVAILHTCDGLRSMSAPLLISARGYLKTIYPDDTWPVSRFATNFLFHELLHNYLYYSFDLNPEEFGDLPPVVRNHLHLMALEKEVFMRLELTDAIAFNRDFYNREPLYKLAVAVVEEKGAEYFLKQLR